MYTKKILLVSTVLWINGCSTTAQNTLPDSFQIPMSATYHTLMGTGYEGRNTPIQVPQATPQRTSTAAAVTRVAAVAKTPAVPTSQFQQLCNPIITFVVREHLAGPDQVPVPSYPSKMFMYTQPHWALSGEEAIGC